MNKYTYKAAEIDSTLSWQGVMYFSGESDEFAEILRHYRAIVDAVAKDSLPEAGQNLLAIMKNAEKYLRMLCPNNYEQSIYYNVPVLAAIKSDDFVEHVLKLKPNSQETVFAAFRGRYDYGPAPLENALADEREWLREVKHVFEDKAATSRLLSKFRILRAVKYNIAPFLASQN